MIECTSPGKIRYGIKDHSDNHVWRRKGGNTFDKDLSTPVTDAHDPSDLGS